MTPVQDYKIGAIVALETHPYFENLTSVIITGEPQHISPLMVIVEIVKDLKHQYDENSGIEYKNKLSCQCKCIWFSSKTQQFEDSWISSKQLKVVKPAQDKEFLDKLSSQIKSIGGIVTLLTTNIEIGKKKSTVEILENSSEYENKKKVNALLSFLCPPLEVIGIGSSESKEPLIDLRTGERKREISRSLVKCKYYNTHAEKFSEVFIPIEALSFIPKINSDIFAEIPFGKIVVYSLSDDEGATTNKTLLKLGNASYRAGYHYVDTYDVINNFHSELLINGFDEKLKEFVNKDKIYSKYRLLSVKIGKIETQELAFDTIPNLASIISVKKPNVFYRIKYIGVNSKKTSVRFISNCSLYSANEFP